MTLQPSYTAVPGATTWDIYDGVSRGDTFPFATAEEQADYQRVEREWAKLAATVDPDDPWSHPEASRLDALVRAVAPVGRRRACRRRAGRSRSRRSPSRAARSSASRLLSDLRKQAVAGDGSFYSYELWESLQVTEGSAEVANRMAAELGGRVRLEAEVTRVSRRPALHRDP